MKEKVTIDTASKICAKTFEAIAIAGIVFLIIGLILHICNIALCMQLCNIVSPFVSMEVMEKL